ncbi:MAG: peroxiredoxin [Novosphingobium sp.]
MTIRPILAAVVLGAVAVPAAANLPVGAPAPVFATQGAKGGKPFAINLRSALSKGPLVLYFYPKAFTKGCTLEAKAFADATPQFAAAGATVVGMSADDLPTLQKFSTEACRDQFAVAIATPEIIKAYNVKLKIAGVSTGLTTRTSYVIGQDGKIRFVHSDMDYKDHVRLTLEAVQKLRSEKR